MLPNRRCFLAMVQRCLGRKEVCRTALAGLRPSPRRTAPVVLQDNQLQGIRTCVQRGLSFEDGAWAERAVKRLGLAFVFAMRSDRGRPLSLHPDTSILRQQSPWRRLRNRRGHVADGPSVLAAVYGNHQQNPIFGLPEISLMLPCTP